MGGKPTKGRPAGSDGVKSDLLKMDFGVRYVDLGDLAGQTHFLREGLRVRKVAPKPGRGTPPRAAPDVILNPHQVRRKDES